MADANRVTVWVQRFADREALQLQWLDPTSGKRRTRSARTADEGEAEKARADLEYELNHGLHRETVTVSWERLRELFEAEHVAGCRPSTRANYRHALDAFEAACSPGALRSLTARTLSAFVARLRPTHQASSIRVYLQYLRTALRWACAQKLLPEVPAFPAVRVPKHRPQPVSEETFGLLLAAAADAEMRAFLLTGWLAGLRISEAVALEWGPTREAPWLDLDRQRIVFPAGFVKADEDQWVPLDPQLRAALLALPRTGRQVFALVSPKTGRRIARVTMTGRIIRLAKRAGLSLSMHATRRGFLCRYAEWVPAQVLQRLARHASIVTTTEYYANVDRAVFEAVLGNTSRNTPATQAPEPLEKVGKDDQQNFFGEKRRRVA